MRNISLNEPLKSCEITASIPMFPCIQVFESFDFYTWDVAFL